MIRTFISSKSIVAKLFRDTGINTSKYIDYTVSWIAEALEMIGHAPTLTDKSSIIEVEDYKLILPYDFKRLDVIYYNSDATEETEKNAYKKALQYKGNEFRRFHQQSPNLHSKHDEYFYFNQNTIVFSFEKGFILMLYKGNPIDEEGYPIIPDHAYFKEAITWYVITKMIALGWKHPAQLNYFQAEQNWEKYCARARSKAKELDNQEYEKIERSWVRHLIAKQTKDHDSNVFYAADELKHNRINDLNDQSP